MKKIILLVIVAAGVFFWHKRKSEANTPLASYEKFVNLLLYDKHEEAKAMVAGEEAMAMLKEDEAYYRFLNASNAIGSIKRNRYELKSQELLDGGNKAKIKVYHVLVGGPARFSAVSQETITYNHEATLQKSEAGWKILDYKHSLAQALEGNRLDWAGLK